MTPRVQALLRLLKSGEYKQYRTRQPYDAGEDVKDLSGMRRIAALHKLSLENERPLIFENDRIGFNRTSPKVAFVGLPTVRRSSTASTAFAMTSRATVCSRASCAFSARSGASSGRYTKRSVYKTR
ncbi:MAG: hypothetical protein IJK23_02070 [Clostridia bacterium]|nr:hypothetical protein [Clostridia bacterium]